MFFLQTKEIYHYDSNFDLPGPAAAHQEEARPARKAMPLYLYRPGLTRIPLEKYLKTLHLPNLKP